MTDVGRATPEVYRLNIEKLPLAVARARRWAALQVVVVATLVTAGLAPLASGPRDEADGALIVGLLAAFALPYFSWRAGRLVRRRWNAFEMSIGAESLRIAARGAGRVTLRFDEIAALAESSAGLEVRSTQAGVVVRVPSAIESYADARARLSHARPVTLRAEATRWSVALVGAASAIIACIVLARRAPGLVVALMLCQLALAAVVVGDVRNNPALARAGKARMLVVALVTVLAPVIVAFR